MKTIIGSAIGVLAIGLILIGAGLRGAASSNAPAAFSAPGAVATANPNVVPVADTATGSAAAGPVMVNCGPGQRALVRQVLLNGETVSQVACVADALAVSEQYASTGAAQLVRPVSYNATESANRAPRTSSSNATARRVVYQQPESERVVQREGRGWKKPLLIIGGSTAAGAGIGGLVGGKKGALIGAALGGGASTIYEATRK